MNQDTLHVRRWETRYQLPDPADGTRARLDRVLSTEVLVMLDTALAAAGITPSEEICVQRVDAATRLSLGMADSRVCAEWTAELVAAIMAAIEEGGQGVVRYRSLHAALADLLSSTAADDLTRAWAWTQLALWPSERTAPGRAAIVKALAVLTSHPRSAPAILAALAARAPRRFRRLLELAPPEAWERLAEAAVDVSSSMVRGLESPLTPPNGRLSPITARSAIARAVLEEWRTAGLAERTLRALARLAFLEAEPAAASHGTAGGIDPIDAIIAELSGLPRRQLEPKQRADTADSAVPSRSRRRPAASEELTRHEAEAITGELTRPRAWTRFGGLLFLLHPIRELGIADEAAELFARTGRSTRWSLHALGLELEQLTPDDPAVLAFAGLAPDHRPPSETEPPMEQSERHVLLEWHTRIVTALRDRLPDKAESDEALLRFITRRRAEIVADPAWIEARFALDDLSTDIRRAGLDLDLGWLPWLGAIVRFAYA